MIITGNNPDGLHGFEVNVYVENKTDKNLFFSIESSSINGAPIRATWALQVLPGKKGIDTMVCNRKTILEPNGIDKVESMEIRAEVDVYNKDDWDDNYQIHEGEFTLVFE